MRFRHLLLPTLAAWCLLAGAAQAATTIGDVATAPDSAVPASRLLIQTADPMGHTYAVPSAGGVITSVSASAEAPTGVPASFTVLAIAGSGATARSRGSATVPFTGDGAFHAVSGAAHIPVNGGERLAFYTPGPAMLVVAADGGSFLGAPPGPVPADGSTIDTPTLAPVSASILASATVEPDADHDGYGDDTQDTCPSSAGVHDTPCTADVQVSASATPGSIARGDVSTIIASIHNGGTGPAPGGRATLTLPAGLKVIAASSTGGECTGTSCDLGGLPAGATRKVYLVVRGASAGNQTVSVAARSELADPDPGNNAASVTIRVKAPVVVKAVKLCKVPSLKGRTRSAARAALKKAGCAAGAVRGSKSKRAKVTSQTIPAKVKVLAGTKVGYTMKAPKKRKAAKKHKR